jgi:PAS domain S-box-containing protein
MRSMRKIFNQNIFSARKRKRIEPDRNLSASSEELDLLITDFKGRLQSLNSGSGRVLGYTTKELMQLNFFELIKTGEREAIQGKLEQLLRHTENSEETFSFQARHQNGLYRWLQALVTVHEPLSTLPGFVWKISDITESKLAEKLRHVNRLYAFISHINHAIIRVHEEKELFREACRIALEIGGFKAAWIGMVDEAGKTLSCVEESGIPFSDRSVYQQIPLEIATWQRSVLERNEHFVCHNVQIELESQKMKELAKERGYNSFVILPLSRLGTVIGTFTLFASEADFFDESEITLLDETTRDISFVLGVFENEKLRNLAELELRKSEERLRTAQAIAKVGSWETDLKTLFVTWSEETYKIFGLEPESFKPTHVSFLDFVHPEERAAVDAAFRNSFSETSPQMIEHRVVLKDGTVKFVLEHWQIYMVDGVPVRAFGTCQDITERKTVDAKLHESENRYRQIVETAQEGIWLVDENDCTIFANNKLAEILGYEPGELNGCLIYDFMDEPEKKLALESMSRRKQGLSGKGTFKYRSKQGRAIWTSVSSNALFDESGKYVGALAMISDITEKMALEELLNKTNAISRFGTWELDLINNTLFWSPITKEIHGLSPDFIPNLQTAIEFYKEGFSRTAITQAVNQAMESGKVWDLELQIITASGKEKWVRAIGRGEFEHGKCAKVYGSFQDIDAIKRTEQELLNVYREKYEILESISDCFYALDKNFTLTYWNKGAETLLGFKRQDVLGKNLWDIFPDAVDTIFHEKYQKVAAENTEVQFEGYYETLNLWVEINIYPSPGGYAVYFRDISKRRKAQEELKESQSGLNAILENSEAAIYSLDRDLRYLTFNSKLRNAIKRRFGKDVKRGDHSFDFLNKQFQEEENEWELIYARALAGETVKFEKEFRFNDVPAHTSFSISPIWTNEQITGLSCFVLDITKQKEDQLLKDKMTADLIQRNGDLEQFSYIVSHNLRAPVANIIGLSNVLQFDFTNEIEREKVEKFIFTAVGQLDEVIKDLNYIIQVKRDVNEKREEVLFSELSENIGSVLQNQLRLVKGRIRTEYQVEKIYSLKSYFYSIFYNLISNSIKYARPGLSPEISIRSMLTEGKIVLSFTDNGLGFDLNKYGDKIFGLYKRFHLNVEGKGMGLFMVKTQVENLGGRIYVSSEVDKGTEFRIEFDAAASRLL